MSILLKPLLVREKLLARGLTVFTPVDFKRIFDLNPWQIKHFLNHQEKAGLILKLRRGWYCLKTDMPGEEEIANRLYQPSYLSLEYTLAKYKILPETVYQVTSVSPKPTRSFSAAGRQYSYLTVKKEAYTGYVPEKSENNRVILMAEPEKALADYWYFVSLGRKPDNDRLNLAGVNKAKLMEYVILFGREGLQTLVRSKI